MAVPLVCECVCVTFCRAGWLSVEKSPALSVWMNADLCCKSTLSSWTTRQALCNYSLFSITVVLAVPTCTRMHCITKKQYLPSLQGYLSHWSISSIQCCLVFNNEEFLVCQSQKIISRQTWRWLVWSAGGKQFVVFPGTSDVTGSRKNKRFWSCIPENIKKKILLDFT